MNNRISILALLSTVFFMIIIASCNKTRTHVDVGWTIVDSLEHPDGSSFILRDSVTGALDSFIEQRQQMFYHNIDNSKYDYQVIVISIYEDSIVRGTIGWALSISARKGYTTSQLRFNTLKGGSITYAPFYTIPFQSTGVDDFYPDEQVFVEIIPEFTVNNMTFENVYHYTYKFNNNPNLESIYWSTKTGFIKIVQNNDLVKRTLEIVRWHIN